MIVFFTGKERTKTSRAATSKVREGKRERGAKGGKVREEEGKRYGPPFTSVPIELGLSTAMVYL